MSAGLIAFLVWKISLQKLVQAFSDGHWPWLVAATAVQLMVLFLWDSICVWWLFSQPDRHLPFSRALRIRCDTVIWSAVNLELGQGAFAWKLSRQLNVPLANTLSYTALLGLFDSSCVMSLALIGSFVYPTPVTGYLRWVCVGVLSGIIVFALTLKFMPGHWRGWINRHSWGSWMEWFDWLAALKLWSLRLIMFSLVMIYAGVGLAICQVSVDPAKVIGIIPFVFLAESLPGTGGLGEREFALVYLYPGGQEHRAALFSFGLIWSTVVIAGRILISLVSWSLPRARQPAEAPQFAASTGPSLRAAGRV